MAEAVENKSDLTASVTQPEVTPTVGNPCSDGSTADVSINVDTISAVTKTSSSDKKEYTEEEKLKRKEFFNKLNKTRKLARENQRHNAVKRLTKSATLARSILSLSMSDEDKKMLDFYKIRLSTLRTENESLHKRLNFLVKENMRFLQMGPPKTSS